MSLSTWCTIHHSTCFWVWVPALLKATKAVQHRWCKMQRFRFAPAKNSTRSQYFTLECTGHQFLVQALLCWHQNRVFWVQHRPSHQAESSFGRHFHYFHLPGADGHAELSTHCLGIFVCLLGSARKDCSFRNMSCNERGKGNWCITEQIQCPSVNIICAFRNCALLLQVVQLGLALFHMLVMCPFHLCWNLCSIMGEGNLLVPWAVG